MKRDVQRAQAIESEKQQIKQCESEMAMESIQMKLAKQRQHEENLKFFDYTKKVKSYKNDLEFKPAVAVCLNMNDKINETIAAAAAERAMQKQTLKEIEKVRN